MARADEDKGNSGGNGQDEGEIKLIEKCIWHYCAESTGSKFSSSSFYSSSILCLTHGHMLKKQC